jgi:hypothetical protein
MRSLAALALCAAAATAGHSPEVSAAMDDEECHFARKEGHPDPDALVCEWLQRDAAGQMQSARAWAKWADGADLCPGHQPGLDTAWVVTAVDYRLVSRSEDRAEYELVREVAGMLVPSVPARFEPKPEQLRTKVVALRTPYGRRLQQPDWLFLSPQTALRLQMEPEQRAALQALPRFRKNRRCPIR